VEVVVILGSTDSPDGIQVTFNDDQAYTPEIFEDVARRALDQALRGYRELHAPA